MLYNFLYNESNISYQKIGTGKSVLLLHGFGEDGNIWSRQVEALLPYCEVIVPDIPGSGLSEVLHNNMEVSIDDYAACIYALLQHEQITECIVLGHSMGGYIALAMVEKYFDLIIAFGLIHSTAFADTEEKKSMRARGIDIIGKYGAFSFIKNTLPNLFTASFKENHPAEMAELVDRGNFFSNITLQQYYYAMMHRPDRRNLLTSSKIPVLFVVGEADVAVPIQDSLAQCYLPKLSYIHIMKGMGHMSMVEAPEELNKFLIEFICS